MLTMQLIKNQWYYHHYLLKKKEKGIRTQASLKRAWPHVRCRYAETEI